MIKLPQIDPARFEAEWEADRDVLAQLQKNGDRPWISRAVDVSFRGSEAALERLSDAAKELGLVVIDMERDDDGQICLFLERDMKTDEASIKALTKKCLQIELLFDVEYDGWGCEAKAGSMH